MTCSRLRSLVVLIDVLLLLAIEVRSIVVDASILLSVLLFELLLDHLAEVFLHLVFCKEVYAGFTRQVTILKSLL